MRFRILRIELRRSVALLAAVLIAAIGVFVLFTSNPPYYSWMQLVVNQRDILQLTWPLALAAGAWQGIRERRSRIEELVGTTPRPRWQRVLPIATAMAIAALITYLAMLAGAIGHLRRIDGYFPAGALPLIALGVLALVAAAWLGLAIGALLPSPLTAPMLFVAGFLALALLPPIVFNHERGRPGASLLFPPLQGPRDGDVAVQTLSTRANLTQALWLAAVAVAGLVLLAAARRRTRIAAVVPVVLGALIAVPAMPDRIADAWVEDRRATQVVCTQDEPKICTEKALSHVLDDVREPARRALAILAAKLPPAPTRVLVERADKQHAADRRSPDTLVVVIGIDDLTLPTADALLGSLLDGAGVPWCENMLGSDEPGPGGKAANPAIRYLAARSAVTAWLLDRDPQPVPGLEGREWERDMPLARETLKALRALPADEQRARVSAFRDAERTCADVDRLELLSGAG